jgi:hypothetical protein
MATLHSHVLADVNESKKERNKKGTTDENEGTKE